METEDSSQDQLPRSTPRVAESASDGVRRGRPGFALVEVLIAILLIDIAILALVTASAVAVSQAGDLGRRRRATELAESRVESLAAQPCGSSSAGIAVPEDGMAESWSSGIPASGIREVADSVEFSEGSATKRIVLRSMVPC